MLPALAGDSVGSADRNVAQLHLQDRIRQRSGTAQALLGCVGLERHRSQLGIARFENVEHSREARAELGRRRFGSDDWAAGASDAS